MTVEQKIYNDMKQYHRIYKAYGKYGITYAGLYNAIKDAGYDDYDTIEKIINNMINKGYIRLSKNRGNKGLKYIITKWVN